MRGKSALLVFGGLTSVVLLAGCQAFGPSAEELEFQADCQTVYENATRYFEWAESVEFWAWGDTYAVTNAGVGSRSVAAMQIAEKFPWMADAMSELEDIHDKKIFEDSYTLHEGYARALTMEALVEGTSFSPVFSGAELEEIKTNQDALYDLVENRWLEYFDLYDRDGIFDSCPVYDEDSWGDGLDDRVNDSLNNAAHSAEQMRVILACQKRGKFQGEKCAKEDYVLDDTYDSEPTARDPFLYPFNDETTQGIAEFTWCWNQGLEVNPSRTGCW